MTVQTFNLTITAADIEEVWAYDQANKKFTGYVRTLKGGPRWTTTP